MSADTLETTRSRFRKALAGEMPADRLPVVEWATWWDQTLARWHGEGLPGDLDVTRVKEWFGLDVDCQLWFPQFAAGAHPSPQAPAGAWIADESDYEALRPFLYPDP